MGGIEKTDVALMTFLGPSLNVNVTRLQVYLSETPAGTSIMNLDHFRQLVINGKYCKYDYGPEKNMEKYGSTIPPDYDLSKITVPTALFLQISIILVSVILSHLQICYDRKCIQLLPISIMLVSVIFLHP